MYGSLLRLCRNLDRNLEIHSVALTELDSDLRLKRWFLNRYGNEPRTTYYADRRVTTRCCNIQNNQNKCYIVDNVSVEIDDTLRSCLSSGVEPGKSCKHLWSLDSVFFSDWPSTVSFVRVPAVAYPSDRVSVDVIKSFFWFGLEWDEIIRYDTHKTNQLTSPMSRS